MVILRYLGFGSCAFSVLILIFEIIKYTERHTFILMTLREAWQRRNVGGQSSIGGSSGASYFTGFPGDVIDLLLNMPLLYAAVLFGVLLLFITRHNDQAR